jgi:hypothetical protein
MYVPLKMSDGPKHKTVYRVTNDVDHFRELHGIEINKTLFPICMIKYFWNESANCVGWIKYNFTFVLDG